MEQELWVKEVETPVSKPLSQWRDELLGYWMVVTDSATIDGVKYAVARYYGTDRENLLDIWNDLCLSTEEPTVEFLCNIRSNWMGGAFIAKANS